MRTKAFGNKTNQKVLVVDDEEAIRSAYGGMLRKKGYEVDTADSGEAAIDMLKKTGYDLVLLDFKLLGMSGIETLSHIRKMKSDVKVLMMSGFFNDSSIDESSRLGVVECLRKPFSVETLAKTIHEALN